MLSVGEHFSCLMCYDFNVLIMSCLYACLQDHTLVVWDVESIKQLCSIEVSELIQAKNLMYHISRSKIQVGFTGLLFVWLLVFMAQCALCSVMSLLLLFRVNC